MRGSTKNKQKAKHFAKELVTKIEDMIEEHNDRVDQLNKKQTKAQKVIIVKGDPKADEEFFMYAADSAQKLKMLLGKLPEAEKIKKQRRDNYEHKIGLIIACIDDLADKEDLALAFDHETIKWAQELGNMADEVSKTLTLLQKQSGGFCFGGSKNTVHLAEKGLIDIISYYHFWLMLPKIRPQVQKQIHAKYLSLTFEESIFFDIDKMVVNQWPQAEVIEVEVEKVVEKTVYKNDRDPSRLMVENSFKDEIERRELAEKCQKLQKQILYEKQLRQAHEMLIGLGRSQNVSKALDIYKMIPEINHSDAKESMKSETQLRINPLICNILGCLYEEGKFFTRDLKKAIEFYIKSASVEDPQGLYKIGKFLQKNMVNSSQLFDQRYSSRREEIRDAIQHYQKAAEKGHLDAITDLGHIYQNGIKTNSVRQQGSVVSNSDVVGPEEGEFIVEPNIEYALKYYTLAKKQNFPRALNNLGALYVRIGDKISETMKGSNIQRGLKYLKKAAELLYPKAYLNLGKCFQNGLGVKTNPQKAKSYYIQGAQLGDLQCKLQLVQLTISTDGCSGKQAVRVAEYLRQIVVADPNNVEALYLMALLYQKGIAVQKSPETAYHFITRAAKLNYPASEVKLGDYYYSGYFVEKNLVKAKHYYQKASRQGYSQGFINLGLLYAKGGLEDGSRGEQLQMANRCLLEAAKLGDANAFVFMNKHTKKDKEIIRQAAQLGSQDAMKMLAKTSSTGVQEVKSIEKVKDQYGVVLNKMMREAVKSPRNNNNHQVLGSGPGGKSFKRTEGPPLSQKQRQMMIYSPRSRVTDQSSALLKIKYNSPQSYRENSSISRQFFRSR